MSFPTPGPAYDPANEAAFRQAVEQGLRGQTPISLTGERDDPESALANLITLLAQRGILIDNTTAT